MSDTELPEAIRVAQQEFDDYLARMLERMADGSRGSHGMKNFKTGDKRDEFADSSNNA
jgi:hypothetical protein